MVAAATITVFGLIYIAPQMNAYLMARMAPVTLSATPATQEMTAEENSSSSSTSSSANRSLIQRSHSSASNVLLGNGELIEISCVFQVKGV